MPIRQLNSQPKGLPQENARAKGLFRDKSILTAVEGYRSLDTYQVQAIIFGGMKTGARKAQERLLKLYRKGKLDRTKADDTYCYFLGEQPGMLSHLVGVNWIRLWLESQLKSWEVVHSFQYELEIGNLRADGFFAIKNTVTGKFKFVMVENDRGTNNFDKIKKYCQLYENEGYSGQWWVELTEYFPSILIATTGERKRKLILKEIEKSNLAGLEFKIVLLEEIKKEVLQLCGGN